MAAQESKESQSVLAGGGTSVLLHCCISPIGPILVWDHFKQLPLVCYIHTYSSWKSHRTENSLDLHTQILAKKFCNSSVIGANKRQFPNNNFQVKIK